jgi:hypothetical protein
VRDSKRTVADFLGFFTKYRVKQFEFGCCLSFTLWCHLSNQNVSRPYLGSTQIIPSHQGCQLSFRWYFGIPWLFLGPSCLTDFCHKLFNMNGCEHILFDYTALISESSLYSYIHSKAETLQGISTQASSPSLGQGRLQSLDL